VRAAGCGDWQLQRPRQAPLRVRAHWMPPLLGGQPAVCANSLTWGGPACSARGGGGGDKKGPAVPGVAYLKDAPEPLVLPSYPAWLAPLATQPKVAADALAPRDGRVFFKKTNLARIKKDNFLRDKKR
jgi:hypothetical protein